MRTLQVISPRRTPSRKRLVNTMGVLTANVSGGAGSRFDRLFFPVLRRSRRFQRSEQTRRDAADLLNRRQERRLVGLGRFVKPADLPHKLQRRRANLLLGDGRVEVE